MPGGPDRDSAGLRLLGLASGRRQALACQSLPVSPFLGAQPRVRLAFKPASALRTRGPPAGGIGWCWLPAAGCCRQRA